VVLGDGYLKRRARWLLHPGGALEVSRGLPRLDSASPPSRRYCQRLGLARDGGGIDTIFHIGMFAAFRPPPPPLPLMLRFHDRTSTILPVYKLLVFLNTIDATPACVLVQLNKGLQLQSCR
jgi:hypothetical protein